MRGVFVLGMHRSGTSLAARLVNLLGVPTCVEGDLLRTTEHNPRGYWESATLTAFNDRLLDALECDWSCPPERVQDWERDEALAALRTEAADLFPTIFPDEQWVWKDPRNCVTFAFWASCLDVEPVVVLVHRNPLEVAASLGSRDGFGTHYSLALWERYLRACLDSIAGLPVLVTDYGSILSDPVAWSETTRSFLEGVRVTAGAPREEDARAFADPALRHASLTAEDVRDDLRVAEPQRSLFETLERLLGEHERLPEVELPAETPLTEALLAEGRRAYVGTRELRREHEELEAYAHDLGQRFLELEEYTRALREKHAALEEYARGLQARLGG
jgi:hypothetical protein